MTRHLLGTVLVITAMAMAAGAQTPAQQMDTCRKCHEALEGRLGNPAQQFAGDIHAARGLTCAACHGGDPREEDMPKAMDKAKGFRGVPKRNEIPQLCARCHSDGAFMRAYNPSLRTDQFAQYQTSVHGKRLREGDTRVAVCTDCHAIHSIRPASSPLSTVHPLQIPATCGRCHADAEKMKSYGIPTSQLDDYRASVHFQTLTGGDLSAPTCVTCHGNHGATPPGVSSVERVCGTCHVFQERLFDESPHKKPWADAKMPVCITCHSNHRVAHTSDALVGTGPQAICSSCHSAGDAGGQTADRIHKDLTELETALRGASAILDRAERAGMEVGEGRLILSNGREKLIKARVDVHTATAPRVRDGTAAGMKLAQQANAAGQQALAENAFRRKGLALSLIVIGFVVLCLWLLIREMERPSDAGTQPSKPGE